MWEITMIAVLAIGLLISIAFKPKKIQQNQYLSLLEFEELATLIDRAQTITKNKHNKELDKWLLKFYTEEMYGS